MQFRRVLFLLALLCGLSLSLFVTPAYAQETPPEATPPTLANYGVRCQDGECKLTVDAAGMQAEVPIPANTPLRFDLPTGDSGLLAGAALEISDRLVLQLPIGAIEMRNGDFSVGLNAEGKVERLRGKADAVVPSLALPNNLRIGGNFNAEFGYEPGAALGNAARVLDADQRYFFLRLGEGFTLDAALPGENGQTMPVTVAVPDDETTTLIVDPVNQALYLEGRFNVSQVVRLAVVGSLLGIDAGQLPMLSGLVLPLRSTVGVAALLSRQPARNFVELNTDLSIEGGPLARLLQLGDRPLLLDSTIRIDRSGVMLQGAADAKLAPNTLLESGGLVEVFVPFQRLSDAYVRLGGDLSVPILGITAENETQLGGAQTTEADDSTTAEAGPSWWNQASTWIGSAASSTATSVAGGTQSGISAVQGAVDAALSSAGAALPATPTAPTADAALSGAAAGVTCGVNRAQQLWCETTGLCEPPADACAPAAQSGD